MKGGNVLIVHYLRGVAALLVCLFHFVYTTIDFVHTPSILNFFSYGKQGVQMFFVISGFVITWAMLSRQEFGVKGMMFFFKRRLIRIEPPYLISILLCVVYFYIRRFVPGTADVDLLPSFSNVLYHVCYLVPWIANQEWLLPVYWTLGIEFQYYLLMGLFLVCVNFNLITHRMLYYLAYILPALMLKLSTDYFFYWAGYFLLGSVFSLYKKGVVSNSEFIGVSLMCIVHMMILTQRAEFLAGFICILLIYMFFDLKAEYRVLHFLGNISYSLYLIHVITGGAIINYGSHFCRFKLEKAMLLLLGLSVTFVFSYMYYNWVEKPFQKLSKQ